jgi:hypothetical protein
MATAIVKKKKAIRRSRKATAPRAVKKKTAGKDIAASYNQFKEFKGQQYTGMQVGRSHKWYYDKGEWKETKITPDLWEISYAVVKRRKGKAPKGSGVPVGTGYHWYIIAHQKVVKLNANDYTTEMTGLKYKLAHKRADKDKWSATAPTQRKHLVSFLKEWIDQLQKEPIPLEFEYKDKTYKGEAIPVPQTCINGVCAELDIILNNETIGIIRHMKSGWKMDLVADQKLVDTIGNQIELWVE